MELTKKTKGEFVYNMLTRQSNKPKLSPSQLSRSIIELRNILNMDNTVIGNNPKFRLSIEDYDKMCKNKILRRITAKVLNTDVKSC